MGRELSPHFSRSPNDFFARPEFRSLRTGTLATQAKTKLKKKKHELSLIYHSICESQQNQQKFN